MVAQEGQTLVVEPSDPVSDRMPDLVAVIPLAGVVQVDQVLYSPIVDSARALFRASPTLPIGPCIAASRSAVPRDNIENLQSTVDSGERTGRYPDRHDVRAGQLELYIRASYRDSPVQEVSGVCLVLSRSARSQGSRPTALAFVALSTQRIRQTRRRWRPQ